MEPIILGLQSAILIGATIAVVFGARLAFGCGKRPAHALWISGLALCWCAAGIPSLLHHHGQYVAWESSHVYHRPGCPYGPNVEDFDTPRPGMKPCDYCAAKANMTMAAAPQRKPTSNETSTVSAAAIDILESITRVIGTSQSDLESK